MSSQPLPRGPVTPGVPPELPAVLYGAYVLAKPGAKERFLVSGKFERGWGDITPEERKYWEVVAKTAVEFITEVRVT